MLKGECNEKITIEEIHAREILDSRGNPTLETEVITDTGICGLSAVPSGGATSISDAFELRDEEKNRYNGKGVQKAINNVNTIISNHLKGFDITAQRDIDNIMRELDGTSNKSNLGANAILSLSLSCASAAAKSNNLPLYRYLGGINAHMLPVPMLNVIHGGRIASNNNIASQEFMLVPIGAKSFSESIRWSTEVFSALRAILAEKGFCTTVGDEGGFVPNLSGDKEAIEFLLHAIQKAGFKSGVGCDFMIALDAVASEMYKAAEYIGEKGNYLFWKIGEKRTAFGMIDYWKDLCKNYPIISIEDPFAEEDWESWKTLTDEIGKNVQIVSDNLLATNKMRLTRCIKEQSANSILIKTNQIGTLTEVIEVIQTAQLAGLTAIVSHRSGETEDTFIADLSVAMNCGQIKAGAPSRTDRVAKYNQLLRIEENLGSSATYAGKSAFKQLLNI